MIIEVGGETSVNVSSQMSCLPFALAVLNSVNNGRTEPGDVIRQSDFTAVPLSMSSLLFTLRPSKLRWDIPTVKFFWALVEWLENLLSVEC